MHLFPHACKYLGGKKRALDSLGLELQVLMSWVMWVESEIIYLLHKVELVRGMVEKRVEGIPLCMTCKREHREF